MAALSLKLLLNFTLFSYVSLHMWYWIQLIHLMLLGAGSADQHVLNVYVCQWVCLCIAMHAFGDGSGTICLPIKTYMYC